MTDERPTEYVAIPLRLREEIREVHLDFLRRYGTICRALMAAAEKGQRWAVELYLKRTERIADLLAQKDSVASPVGDLHEVIEELGLQRFLEFESRLKGLLPAGSGPDSFDVPRKESIEFAALDPNGSEKPRSAQA